MAARKLHRWNLSYPEAVELQRKLASKVSFTALKKTPELIAGIDCAFTPDKKKIIGCVVVLEYPEMETVEIKHAVRKTTFPYIPGLLSFREGPVCLSAVGKLKNKPDMFMIDGQGTAHPRRLGLAAHLGLFLDKPTIGCAKSRLTGTHDTPGVKRGDYSFLYDGKDKIGAVLRTRDNVRPIFVSVGNKCTLKDAIKWVLNCGKGYRIPEPTRIADIQVAKIKKSL